MANEKREEKVGHDISADPVPANDEQLAQAAMLRGDKIPGIDQALVDEWTKSYGKLFVIYHLGVPFVYRAFGYHEFKALKSEVLNMVKNAGQNNVQDDLFKEVALKKFVLWPKNFKELMDNPDALMENGNRLPAGIPYILGDYLMASSGFMEAEPFIVE